MKSSRTIAAKHPSAEQQLKGLLTDFEPKHRTLFRTLRKAIRRRFPSANELVYDYPSSLVIGYSPMERGSDSVVAIALRADGLRLYFNQGPALPDPKKILLGSGKQTRYILIESPGTLNLPEVKALLDAAAAVSKFPIHPQGRGTLIIKSSTAKQRTIRKSKR